jgi:predicted nucleic acid-binding protein
VKGFLLDSNILLDIATADATWLPWSSRQLRLAAAAGSVFINPIIYAEIAPAFGTSADLDRWLGADVFQRLPLPYSAAWLAAQAYIKYRRSGGARNSPLPDFFIGAHAEAEQLTLITRDAARYRTYFPSVVLVAPS